MNIKFFRCAAVVAIAGSMMTLSLCKQDGGKKLFLPLAEPSVWTRLMGVASQTTRATAVVVDKDGNSYLTGYTAGALDGETLSGFEDMFLVKYNAGGKKLWTKLFGVAGATTHGMGIYTDSINLYVTGSTSGNLDGKVKSGTFDAFVMAFDTDGVKQWTTLLGVAGAATEGYGVAAWAGSWIYVTGYTTGNLCGETKTGNRDAFLIRLFNDGSIGNHALFGASGANSYGTAISHNSTYPVITGYTNGNLNGETLNGTQDVFIIGFDIDCTAWWTKLIGVSGKTTRGYGIVDNKNNYSYVTGYTDGTLNGETLTGSQDLFVMKIKYDGDLQWTRLLGVASKITNGLAIVNDNNDYPPDSLGRCWVAGYTTGDLDGKKLTGTSDAFVVEYDSSGTKQSTRLSGVESADTRAYGIGIYLPAPGTNAGTFSVAGYTTGALNGEDQTGTMDLFVTTKLNR
jgi:hypothetical protein